VYPHNQAAIALYRRFGFEQEGRLVRHAKKSYGYEDEILMAVWIGPKVDGGSEGSISERESASDSAPGAPGEGAERV
jgi:hypothetical protein